MLSLDSPRWSELTQAYGSATGIPALLRQLESSPGGQHYTSEPWHSLWSALCHQGTVYSASFAAVPHIVRAAASNPLQAGVDFFQLPACIEIARHRNRANVPADVAESYFESIAELPGLVGAAAARDWDADFLLCALSAIAAAKGFPDVAEAALELNPEVASQFLEWFFSQ